MRPVDAKIQAILAYPVLQTRRELCCFLGMADCYRGFCKNFADVVAPLTSLTSVKKLFAWSPACQHAFESCKALLCSTPVLVASGFMRLFKLEVDASERGAGAVLLQEDEQGIDHPICYFYKKFNVPQVHYSNIEKEALLLLLALQYFEVLQESRSGMNQTHTFGPPGALVMLFPLESGATSDKMSRLMAVETFPAVRRSYIGALWVFGCNFCTFSNTYNWNVFTAHRGENPTVSQNKFICEHSSFRQQLNHLLI